MKEGRCDGNELSKKTHNSLHGSIMNSALAQNLKLVQEEQMKKKRVQNPDKGFGAVER